MSPATPPRTRYAKHCPVTRALHAETKSEHPRWVYCPDCDLQLPSENTEFVNLITPPRPTTTREVQPQTTSRTRVQPSTALLTGSTPISIPPRPPKSFVQCSEDAIRDRHRSERETRPVKKPLSVKISVVLFSAEWVPNICGGLQRKHYVQTDRYAKLPTKSYLINEKYDLHDDLIEELLVRGGAASDALSKTWRLIVSISSGKGRSITEIATNRFQILTIGQAMNATNRKKAKGDTGEEYVLQLVQEQEVEVIPGSDRKNGKKVPARYRPANARESFALLQMTTKPQSSVEKSRESSQARSDADRSVHVKEESGLPRSSVGGPRESSQARSDADRSIRVKQERGGPTPVKEEGRLLRTPTVNTERPRLSSAEPVLSNTVTSQDRTATTEAQSTPEAIEQAVSQPETTDHGLSRKRTRPGTTGVTFRMNTRRVKRKSSPIFSNGSSELEDLTAVE